jgi:microcystin-dependent protein
MNTATDVAPLMPPGTIIMYGADSAPAGWLGCEGGTVSRTTYAALFAVIGTNFGAGDGSTTFTLPNFNDRVAAGKATNVGYSPSGTTIGSSGILTAAGGALSLSVGTSSVATASKDAGSATVVTSVTGSTSSITVTQAFQGVKFIIKT